MPRAARNTVVLVLNDLSSLKGLGELTETIGHGPKLYQLLFRAARRNRSLTEVADRLVALAEQAYGFRQMEALDELSRLLRSLPLPPQYEHIGLYYQALRLQKPGNPGLLEQSASLLQGVADHATPFYRGRALQSLGVNSVLMADYRSALKQYREFARLTIREGVSNAPATVSLQLNLAIIQSIHGNHAQALALLERTGPLAQSIRGSRPHLYYQHLNSLAVELGEAGRLDEAYHSCRLALSSPFACVYPEWYETKQELELRRRLTTTRSQVAFCEPLQVVERVNNVVPLHAFRRGPDATAGSSPTRPTERARILTFQNRKDEMAKQSHKTNNIAEQIKQMSHGERVMRLLELISSSDTTPEELAKILEIAEAVAGRGKKQG